MTDASTVSYSAPGPGTVPVSAADLFDSGPMFAITKGAVADGVTPATAGIQAAIDEIHARGGGVVQLDAGSYNLGSNGLVLRSTSFSAARRRGTGARRRKAPGCCFPAQPARRSTAPGLWTPG